MSKVSLKDAEEAHKAVITSQQKQITNLYEKWANEMAEQAKKYASSKNPSAALKSQQITQLEGALRKAGEQTANAVNGSIKQSMARASQAVVASNAEWMEKLGFPEGSISAAFSSVPTEIVQNIITGQVYEGGWSLAKSIWGDNEDTLSKAYEMVAGGIAENKSVYDIAKDLEQYVSPSAKKPWNYTFESVDKVTGQKKTYRVYPKKVDYNAQRLARTLSQHAYQQTMVAVNKDNPLVQKIKWHSTGSRVCPICMERNGRLYDKNEVPMDHPNGMCILEPVYDKDTNKRLADWVNGKEDPVLDAYAKKLGITSGDMTLPVDKGKVVQGDPNAINTWHRRSDEFGFEIEDVMAYQGFDGLPKLVDADEFDKLVKQSNFVAQRTYSASTKEILDAYRDQLYHGKWYVDCSTGGAQYGQGMYCAADWTGKLTDGIKEEMRHYQDLNKERGNVLSYTETLTLDESARVITYNDLVELASEEDIAVYDEKAVRASAKVVYKMLYKKNWDSLTDEEQNKFLDEAKKNADFEDYGSYAVAKGYDAINAEGHGQSGSYTVILNRTKLVIKKG